ncbi:DNA-protecting protein DprA [Candidatus Berkelbacteria bacterium]|nr:DNA-protecting protein DprA [Candidatus Berkelbacteria bacterium]
MSRVRDTISFGAIYAALASEYQFGARHFAYLRATGRPLSGLWELSVEDLLRLGIPQAIVELFASVRTQRDPVREWEKLAASGIDLITIEDPDYPSLLRELAVPPAVLYVRGVLSEDVAVAIVGTRKMTQYGRRVATDLCHCLAGAGVITVSGLALGIDGQVHRETLQAHGKTWAILPGGVDVPYPAAHRGLAREIVAAGGALVSEFPPGSIAAKHHFPIRNRIIAGLARATVVVEAMEQSGSLLTARSALEANRDVFTVPGSIYSPYSAGPHHLIQMGAKLVHDPKDILTELHLDDRIVDPRNVTPDSAEEATILDTLSTNVMDVDQLSELTRLEPAMLISTLTLMEMKGRVRNLGANQYVRT